MRSIDTRTVGLVIVALGGGRTRVEDEVDHSVGLTEVAGIGEPVDADHPLAVVHARNDAEAKRAADSLQAAFSIGDAGAQPGPVVATRITS